MSSFLTLIILYFFFYFVVVNRLQYFFTHIQLNRLQNTSYSHPHPHIFIHSHLEMYRHCSKMLLLSCHTWFQSMNRYILHYYICISYSNFIHIYLWLENRLKRFVCISHSTLVHVYLRSNRITSKLMSLLWNCVKCLWLLSLHTSSFIVQLLLRQKWRATYFIDDFF